MGRLARPKYNTVNPNIVEYAGVKVDLDNLEQYYGQMADVSEMVQGGNSEAAWANWEHTEFTMNSSRYRPWERLEGKYSATKWLRMHPLQVRRYLLSRFHKDEVEGRYTELINHPTKLRHLVMDGSKSLDEKLNTVVKHIGQAESQIYTVTGGRGGGKALALDTPIPTLDGWSTMGRVDVGDWVIGRDGLPTRVTATSEVQIRHTCYRFTFDDGASIVADANHLWVISIDDGPYRVAKTHQILAGLVLSPSSIVSVPNTQKLPAKVADALGVPRNARPSRRILSIEPTESVPVKCIVVNNQDHIFLAGRELVPTHNSTTVGILMHMVHERFGRTIKYLDTRPKDKLPYFAERIVDLRDAEPSDLVVVDEGADQFSNRNSTSAKGRALPVILATARHRQLSLAFLAPVSSLVDVSVDKLSDGVIIKPQAKSGTIYERASAGSVAREFPEMIPSLEYKEWGVFCAGRVAPTSFCLPYHCPPHEHNHGWPCAIPSWWTRGMSLSQMQAHRGLDDPDIQELAMRLLYWSRNLIDIQETMAKSGADYDVFTWVKFFLKQTNGVHPRTEQPLVFPEVGYGQREAKAAGFGHPEEAARESRYDRKKARDAERQKQQAHLRGDAEA